MSNINPITRKRITILLTFILIIAAFFLVITGSGICSVTYSLNETTVPILTYHKFCIGDSPDDYTINIDLFEEHIAYLNDNGYKIISISQLLECIRNNFFPEKPVVITIDDGFKSVYELAFPILKKYQIPANLFLYTDFIGNGHHQLSWQQIREMIDTGIEIGSHTLSHSNLLNMKKDESHIEYLERIEKEITLSRTILERNTGVTVESFAYPYGVYSREIKMIAEKAGYEALLNVNSMNNSIPIDPFSLNRQIIPAGFSKQRLVKLLQQKTLEVYDVFPADGAVTDNQEIKIGALLNNPNIEPDSLFFRLSGSGLLNYDYCNELHEVSFTPVAPKLLQKRTWIANITAYDKITNDERKKSWLFTIR